MHIPDAGSPCKSDLWESSGQLVGITPRQRALLSFIAEHAARSDGASPSSSEMASALGLRSRSAVGRMLRRLTERGALRRIPGRHRALEVRCRPLVQFFRFDEASKTLVLHGGRVGA
ncbi:MAG TPA: MarR family transcriptional regulator [Xanthobacteraceae bacterium]|nr:MarR family transcriptional regulator [Xanthobacteraceae bacterium]